MLFTKFKFCGWEKKFFIISLYFSDAKISSVKIACVAIKWKVAKFVFEKGLHQKPLNDFKIKKYHMKVCLKGMFAHTYRDNI